MDRGQRAKGRDYHYHRCYCCFAIAAAAVAAVFDSLARERLSSRLAPQLFSLRRLIGGHCRILRSVQLVGRRGKRTRGGRVPSIGTADRNDGSTVRLIASLFNAASARRQKFSAPIRFTSWRFHVYPRPTIYFIHSRGKEARAVSSFLS